MTKTLKATPPPEEAVGLTVGLMKLSEVRLYERNARTHDTDQIETISALMEEFGYTNPALIDVDEGNFMVAGHGRHAALSNLYAMGRTVKLPNGRALPAWTIPFIDCSGWTAEQRRAYILADNQSALRAGWDPDLLKSELEWLRDDAGFDLSLTGFTSEQLDAIFAPVIDRNDRDPDAVPPVLPDPHSQPGDVWVLGPHRVICADATVKDTWLKLLGTELLDCVWTDPPYNVDIGEKNKMLDRADGGKRANSGSIENDKMSDADFYSFIRAVYGALFAAMKPGAPIYVAHSDREGLTFRKAFAEAGFKLSNCLMWRKDQFVLGMMDFQSMHEPILYGWRPGAKHRWFGGRKQTTVIDVGNGNPFTQQPDGRWAVQMGDQLLVVDATAKLEVVPGSVIFHEKPKRSQEHPTMKPTALVEKMLTNSARAGHLIGDAFGGSGTTLIAADRLGMAARLSELDPRFVDVIVRRWQNYTGRVAVHLETGEPFPVAPDVTQGF